MSTATPAARLEMEPRCLRLKKPSHRSTVNAKVILFLLLVSSLLSSGVYCELGAGSGDDDVTTSEPTVEPTTVATPSATTMAETTMAEPTTIVTTESTATTEGPTTVEPTTVEPTTVEPTTVEPTTLVPTTVEPTTVVPTTLEPTTEGPTTLEPTTVEPTTLVPTTVEPTTVEPTTLVPTTVEPTTLEPTTVEPTTLEPTTVVPTTLEPTTLEPTTVVPTTLEPTTVVPTTLVPTTLEPTTVVPTTLEPTTVVPTTVVPTTLEPTTVVPTTVEPTTEEPTTMEPTTLVPTTMEPTTVVPTTMEPTTMEPTTVEPTTEEPGLSAVANLTVMFIPDNSAIEVEWVDELNTLMDNLTYLLSYNIFVTGTDIVLLNYSTIIIVPDEAMLVSTFSEEISSDGFMEGVSVDMIVSACTLMGKGPSTQRSFNIEGDFAPQVVELVVMSLPGQDQPAVTMTWSDPFNDAPPSVYLLTVNGTELTGSLRTDDRVIRILPEDTDTVTLIPSDHTYDVTGLLFYSEYDFILVAIYNFTGTPVRSAPVQFSDYVTEQGVPGPVMDLMISFESQFISFDSASRMGNANVSISWSPPLEPNGVIVNHTLSLFLASTSSLVGVFDVEGNVTSASFVVSVLPYAEYSVNVTATSMSQASSVATSDPQFSPQTEPSPVINATLLFNSTSVMNSDNGDVTVTAQVFWTEPEMLNGVLTAQSVTISSAEGAEIYSNGAIGVNVTSISVTVTVDPGAMYFATVAITNGAGSSEANTSMVTSPQGVPDAVSDITVSFNETLTDFNPTSRVLTTPITISWQPPPQLYGQLMTYSVSVQSSSGAEVYQNSSTVPTIMAVVMVLPSEMYVVMVTATTGGGMSTFSSNFTSPEAAPSPPNNVEITNITSRSAIISWSPPTYPNGIIQSYTIRISAISGTERTIDTGDDDLSFSLDMLAPFSQYSVSLRAVNTFVGEISETVTFNTSEDAPSPPNNVEITNITSRSAIISWSPPTYPNGIIQSYTIRVSAISGEERTIDTGDDDLSFFLDMLAPFSQYSVSLRAVNTFVGEISETVTFNTSEDAPSAVRNLVLMYNGSHFCISWEEPLELNGILNYTISFTGRSLVTMELVVSENAVVTGLEFLPSEMGVVYTLYTAVVVSQTGGGVGPERSGNFTTPQGIPSAVRSVDVSLDASGILVEWLEPMFPNGELQYTITLERMDLARVGNMLEDLVVVTTETRQLFSLMTAPYTVYMATVVAITAAGGGEAVMGSFQTDEEIPSNISMLTINYNATHIVASWTEPVLPNGDLRYLVSLVSTDLLLGTTDVITAGENVSVTEYVVEEVVEFYTEYEITVVPFTGAGEGSGAVESFATPEGEPSEPRDVTLELTNSTLELTNSTLVTTWDSPLTPNGVVTYQLNITVTDLATVQTTIVLGPITRNDSNRLVEVTLDIVEAHATYIVSVRSMTTAGTSASVTDSHTTEEGVSQAVENLMVVVTNTTATVTWTPPLDANGVISSYMATLTNNTDTTLTLPLTVQALEANFTDLRPFGNYSVSVQPFTFNDLVPGVSQEESFTTQIGIPSEVLAVRASPEGTGALLVIWDQPTYLNAPTVNYTVTYYGVEAGEEMSLMTSTGADKLQAIIPDLRPFTNYSIIVQACSEAGCGSDSEPVVELTLEEAPSTPRNFTLAPVSGSPTVLEANWTSPISANGVIRNYTVECNDTLMFYFDESGEQISSSADALLPLEGSGTPVLMISVFLQNLTPFTTYECSVSASTGGGRGEASDTDLATTEQDVPAAPGNFVLMTVDRSSNTLSASWMVPVPTNGMISGYAIRCNSIMPFMELEQVNVDGADTSMTLTGLSPYTEYECTISASTGAGEGSASEPQTARTDEAVPTAPGNFVLSRINGSSDTLSASWMIPAPTNGVISSYTIRCNTADPNTDVPQLDISPLNTSATLTGLSPYTEYECTISASTGAGEGDASGPQTARTDEAVPSAPRNFMLSTIQGNSTTLRASWMTPDPTNGEISGYTIDCSVVTTDVMISSLNVDAPSTTATLTGLMPFTEYECTISASTGAGEGSSSEPSRATTDEDVPSAPREFSLSGVNGSPDTLSASWTEPDPTNGNITGYTIRCSIVDTDPVVTFPFEGTASEGNLTDLMPFTEYRCTISASTSVGEGDESQPQTERTDEAVPAAPGNFVLMTVDGSSNTLSASWMVPVPTNGVISGYAIRCNSTEPFMELEQVNVDRNSTSMTLTGLSPYTEYECVISASTGAGEGSSSEPQTARTDEAAPSVVLGVMAMAASSTAVNATWTVPAMANGNIRHYLVSYYRTGVGRSDIQKMNTTSPVLFVELTGLDIFTEYDVFVQAFTVDFGPESEVATVRTNEDAPSAPNITSATSPTFSTILLVWTAPEMQNGMIRNYQITYFPTESGDTNAMTRTTNSTELQFTISDLEPFTDYSVSVSAITIAVGNTSEIQTVRTIETTPGAVTGLDVMDLTARSIRVTFSPPSSPNGIITTYEILYVQTLSNSSIGEDESLNITAVPTTQMYSRDITGLLPFTSYRVSVRAYTSVGAGEVTVRFVETDPEAASPPTNFTVVGSTAESITLAWGYPDNPHGAIVGYVIRIGLSAVLDDGMPAINITLDNIDDSNAQTRIVEELTPFTSYYFTVRAYSFGEDPFVLHDGMQSEVITGTTTEAAPSAPGGFTLSPASDNPRELVASWNIPDPANGRISSYRVTCNGSAMFLFNDLTDQAEVTVMLEDLTPFTTYECSVSATTTGGGRGEASDTAVATTGQDVPAAPGNFTLMRVDDSSNTLSASWMVPVPANGMISGYAIRCNSTEPFMELVDGDSTSMTLTGLSPYTEYECTISASTGAGEGSSSEPQTARTDEAVPTAPRNFVLSRINGSSDTLSASWMIPAPTNGVISNYTIQCSITGSDAVLQTTVDAPSTSTTLTDLVAYTEYMCTISASTGAGGGEEAGPRTARTDEAVPSAPRNFMLSTIEDSSNTLRASWLIPEPTNGEISGYTIDCSEVSTDVMIPSLNIEAPSTTATLTGLTPFTEYECTISASTGAGEGSSSEPSRATTEEDVPSAPREFSLSIVDGSPDTLSASWTEPDPTNGDITGYTIRCSIADTDPVVMTNPFSFEGTASEGNLIGLMPFTEYECTISASTSAGEGSLSGPQTARTDEDVPGDPPQNFTVTEVTAISAVLSWSPPSLPNGIITYYIVTFADRTEMLESSVWQYTAEDLNENSRFIFNVAARTAVGPGPSASRTITTAEDAPSGAPNNLTVTAVSPTTLNVTWLPPDFDEQNGVLLNYTITYFSPSGNPVVETTPNTEILLEGLEEFTTYVIIVNASTAVGVGPGDNFTTRTPRDVPGMIVTIDSFDIESSTTATVQWTALADIHHNDEEISYTIRLMNVNQSTSEIFNTSNTSMTITTLVPFTVYQVEVAAVNSVGRGPYASVVNQTLEGVPDPPTGLDSSETEFNSTVLTWSPPAQSYGILLRYLVQYERISPTQDQAVSTNVTAPSTTHTLTDLNGNSRYRVTVYAYTSAGGGNPVQIEFMTPAGPPPVIMDYEDLPPEIVPKMPQDMSESPDSFMVEFAITPELEVNGPVDKFVLYVQRLPSTNTNIATWYESNMATSNFPQYAALEEDVVRNSKKRQANGETQMVQVGGSDDCGPEDTICNGPLVPGSDYGVRYRLFSGEQFSDFPFAEEAVFSTAPTPEPQTTGSETTGSTGSTGSAALGIGAAVAAVFIVILFAVLVIVIVFILYNRKRTGKMDISKTLLPNDSPQTERLQPPEDSIVPKDVRSPPAVINARFQLHHTQANTKKIYIKDFGQHLQNMLEDSGYKFSEEYERVTEIGLEHAKEASLQAENRAKNRYTNILAYDHSRVKLSFVDDEPGSDYINASYIPGHRMRRAYIATQGPLPATFDDFWRMVWEQNTHVVVMLTQLVERGRTKCHRYWPGTEPIVYGDIAVEMLSEKDKEDWTIREFKLSLDEKRHRLVRHFQFTSWPDHGVPENPVTAVDFVKAVRCYVESIHGPIVVHCSAGVGRTGCFITLDNLVLHIKDHDWVDIFGLACEMRQHRNHMIQTEAQYVFIHKAMLEIIDSNSMTSYRNGTSTTGSHYSQGSGYPTLFINRYTEQEESLTQMSDYYGDCLSEETHM